MSPKTLARLTGACCDVILSAEGAKDPLFGPTKKQVLRSRYRARSG